MRENTEQINSECGLFLRCYKQRNVCKQLLRTTKKLYSNIDIKNVVDNRSFWKTVFRYFIQNVQKGDKIILNENDTWVSNDDELCQFFCGYFSNMISDLQIRSISKNISNVADLADLVLAEFNMFQDNPS